MPLIAKWSFGGSSPLIDGSLGLMPDSLSLKGGDVIFYISDDGVADEKYWKPWIIEFTPPLRKLDYLWGGFSRFDFGSISISPDMFVAAGKWPPPMKGSMDLWHTNDTYANRQLIFSGALHRNRMEFASGISYDIKTEKYDVKLLSEREDYNGDVSAMPRAFGAVVHAQAKRLPDAGGKPSYYNAHVAGALGTDWHVYDDGVNIDSKASESGDGLAFTLSSPAVGEVTISGTGEIETLLELLTWAATGTGDDGTPLLGVTISSTYAEIPSPSMAHYETSQQSLVDFCSEVAAWFTHFFYIEDGILHLVDMEADNGTDALSQFEISEVSYQDQAPVNIWRSKWTTRSAVEETVGKYVKDVENEASVSSLYSYGDEKSVRPFSASKSDVEACLSAIDAIYHSAWATVRKPLDGLPVLGRKYTVTDCNWKTAITLTARAREIRYEFDATRPMAAITLNGGIA